MTGNFSPLNKLCTPTKLCLSQETQEGLRHLVLGGKENKEASKTALSSAKSQDKD